MSSGQILVIEDDPGVATIVHDLVVDAGYSCDVVSDGMSGLQRALEGAFALVILDLGLPLLDGLDICQKLRAAHPHLPILILTARGDETDVVVGIEMGADDYVQKPFRPRELLARIRARLRDHTRRAIDAVQTEKQVDAELPLGPIEIGEVKIDPDRMRVMKRGQMIHLTAREYEVVLLLAENAGRPVHRDDLLSNVWESSVKEYAVNISVFMSRLRAKIEDDLENPTYIITVRGVGYRFVEPEELAKSIER